MALLGSSESYGFARFIRRKGLSQRKNKVKRLMCPSGWQEYSTDGRWGQVEDYEWVEMDKMEETRTRTEAAVSNVVSLTARRA